MGKTFESLLEASPILFTIVPSESFSSCAVVDKWKLFTKAEEIIKFFGRK
jgi:hypothetical protein